ncbi:MAG: hypothetical protein J0M23_07725 [Rickettsiales bacterium]|nr:hypothetical protein [Rickettsiales bacterium]
MKKKINYTYINALTGSETTADDPFALRKSVVSLSISKRHPGKTPEEVAEQGGLVHLLKNSNPEGWKLMQSEGWNQGHIPLFFSSVPEENSDAMVSVNQAHIPKKLTNSMKKTFNYTYINALTGTETTADDPFALRKSVVSLSISKRHPGKTPEEVAEQGGLVHLLKKSNPEAWKLIQSKEWNQGHAPLFFSSAPDEDSNAMVSVNQGNISDEDSDATVSINHDQAPLFFSSALDNSDSNILGDYTQEEAEPVSALLEYYS